MNIYTMLGPNVDAQFRAFFETAADKASPRRFTGEPLTGFGTLPEYPERSSQELRQEAEHREPPDPPWYASGEES
jgi:hypothetical protein